MDIIKYIISAIVGAILTYFIPKLLKSIRKFAPRRKKIKESIEKGINEGLRMTFEGTFGLPVLRYNMKIEWVENVDKSTYLNEEGDLVIKLSCVHDKNQSRSFAKSLMLYLDESFMPEAKPFASERVYEGCKYTIAKEITFKRDIVSYRHFIADYLSPLLSQDSQIEEILNELESISQRGLFRTILLRELYFLCSGGSLPKIEIREEVKSFVKFLWNIANKEEYEKNKGEKPPLDFIKKYIKISLVLVKRWEVESLSPYVRAGEIAFRNGAQRVYVTGWGAENIKNTREIAQKLSSQGFCLKGEIEFEVEFPEAEMPANCFLFEGKK